MRIVIYNSSSFGGCFDYGRELLQAYRLHPEVSTCEWWLPENAETGTLPSVRKIFLSDKPAFRNRFLKQLHFLWRSFLNPFLLYFRLAAAPASVVIMNDFEQLSAPFWVPLFQRTLAARHRFVVLLHDPDRDAYPPSLRWTQFSMKTLMGLMDFAFYHDYLPEKAYYRQNSTCTYLDLPHGIFQMPAPDSQCLELIGRINKEGLKLMSIPGNIRPEKNYRTAIEALVHLPGFALLIAGAASNARVDVKEYKDLADKLGVNERVYWMEHYLSAPELSAVIAASDVVVLNYADSFTSQSGILNVAAPFRKPLVVSDSKSSLASVVRKFKMGTLVSVPDAGGLAMAVKASLQSSADNEVAWENYLTFASWKRHVDIAIDHFRKQSGSV